MYQSESDRALVQAVSVQVRGMVLQKLGKLFFLNVQYFVQRTLILWLFYVPLQACG